MLNRSGLLSVLLLSSIACSTPSGEGEGESDAGEGEGDTAEGEGDTAEGEGEVGEGEGEVGEGEGEPLDCSALAVAPASFERLSGFTSSEDFAFDAQGNYIGVDELGNVVRISIDGTTQLWFPNIGGTAGMAMLPDGSLIVADVGRGAVVRLSEDANLSLVLGGLAYPNGLDIGPDGFIYVAENFAGRVRRIDPYTGEFTIVAIGLTGPNGVAFGDDPSILYVGSFEGSGVYRVDIPTPGALGTARVFARPHNSSLPEPEIACPEGSLGEPCTTTTGGAPGVCTTLANVLDCVVVDACAGQQEGDSCGDNGERCVEDDLGTLVCGYPNPCDGLDEGDACTIDADFFGTCSPDGGGGLYCNTDTCAALNNGDACVLGGVSGICVVSDGFGYCNTEPCSQVPPGSVCTLNGSAGICVEEFGYSYCDTSPCRDVVPGTPCSENNRDGVCVINDGGFIDCNTDSCLGATLGSNCTNDFGAVGTCTATGDGSSYCETNPCRFLELGQACTVAGLTGTCDPQGCDTNPCATAAVGSACVDVAGPGVCVDNISEGRATCAPNNPCVTEGDACGQFGGGVCSVGLFGLFCSLPCTIDTLFEACSVPSGSGTCYDDGAGATFCVLVDCQSSSCSEQGGVCDISGNAFTCSIPSTSMAVCAGANDGQLCAVSATAGVCLQGFCRSVGDECEGLVDGDSCTQSNGLIGVCSDSSGYLLCGDDNDAACIDNPGGSCSSGVFGGVCAISNEDGSPVCVDLEQLLTPPCDGVADDQGCFVTTDAGLLEGYCYNGYCNVDLQGNACNGLDDGDACVVALVGASIPGTCSDDYCSTSAITDAPGGIDGLGVDACGNVYASEFVNGTLWRIAPNGDITELADLPSSWVPNIKWGRGVGGFSNRTMYVADRDQGSLFAVDVGVPGATEFYDLGQP
jgi:sugar lactone lactonase YvrE